METVTPDTTSLETVTLKPLMHKGAMQIGIYFPVLFKLNGAVRKAGAAWSQSNKCWYIPCTQADYKKLTSILKDKAQIEATALKEYLQQKKLEVKNSESLLPWQHVISSKAKQSQPPQVMAKEESGNTAVGQTPNLSAENQLQLQKYIQHLTLKAYSPSTIRTYTAEFSSLLQTIKSYPAEKLTADDIKRYLQKLLDSGIKENTIHSKLNALKFYYEQVLKKEKFFFDIPRPKKPLQIPKMFSKEDIEKILKATENLKHKTALLLCYSSGLRVSEVVALTVPAIDSKRMVINILAAKGKKDRIVPLSKTTLKYLQHYYKAYKPKHHFFEGQYEGEPWSSRSLQKVLDNAKRKVRINKPGSIHALRHSYATHLLDKGVDITYIQKILGHNDLKTTLRYLHVTIRDLTKIESPIEDLDFE